MSKRARTGATQGRLEVEGIHENHRENREIRPKMPEYPQNRLNIIKKYSIEPGHLIKYITAAHQATVRIGKQWLGSHHRGLERGTAVHF